jgi:hypothetical protein
MAELKINGKVKMLMDAQTFDSGFTKREFVVTTQEQYPQDVKLECTQQRVNLLDSLKEGDNVDVFFNIRGNEYNGKYFVNLQAWKIEGATAGSTPAPQPVAPDTALNSAEDDGDLPF